MELRKLGSSGIKVSPIGLGCMGMSHAYGPIADSNEMVKLINKALDLGCNFFDTAVVYGEENEKFLGKALENRREEAVIATKFGITGQKIVDGNPVNILDSKPDSIKQQLEDSLKRLNTDYIDMYYQHRIDPEVEPEAVAEVMNEFIDEGKIKAWGLSNAPFDYLKRAHEVCPIAAIENQYSMVWRQPEGEVFDLCEKLGISFVAYSPLGNGFLSGKYTKGMTYPDSDFRSFMSRFKEEVMDQNQVVLDLLNEYADMKNATPAQIVLAWELAQKPFIIPIPGTTKIHRLEENLKAWDLKLSKKELSDLNEALSRMDINESFF